MNFQDSINPDNNFLTGVFGALGQPARSKYHFISQYNASFEGYNLYQKVFDFNIRGFIANSEDFLAVLTSLSAPPKIIILTETWLSHDDRNMCSIEGYNCHHTIRDGGRGGGFVQAIGLNTECVLALCPCDVIMLSRPALSISS